MMVKNISKCLAILILTLLLSKNSFGDEDRFSKLEERIDDVENDLFITQAAKNESAVYALDNSSFAQELVLEVKGVRDEVTQARINIGKGAATLESLKESLLENKQVTDSNTSRITGLDTRLRKVEVEAPVRDRRISKLEDRDEKRRDTIRSKSFDFGILIAVAFIAWIAKNFCQKHNVIGRAIKKANKLVNSNKKSCDNSADAQKNKK